MPNNEIKRTTFEEDDDCESTVSGLSSCTTNDYFSEEIAKITNELKSLQNKFFHLDASEKCISIFNKPHHKSTAFLQCALEILDKQSNRNAVKSDYDKLNELHSLYVKQIQIRLIEKPDMYVKSRTAEINRALTKTALGSPDIFTLSDDSQNKISAFRSTSAS